MFTHRKFSSEISLDYTLKTVFFFPNYYPGQDTPVLGALCAGWASFNDTEHSRRSERKGRKDAKIAFILLLPISGKNGGS